MVVLSPGTDASFKLCLRPPHRSLQIADAELRVQQAARIFQDKEIAHITAPVLFLRQRRPTAKWRKNLFACARQRLLGLGQLFARFAYLEGHSLFERKIPAGGYLDLALGARNESLIVMKDRQFCADARAAQDAIGADLFGTQ